MNKRIILIKGLGLILLILIIYLLSTGVFCKPPYLDYEDGVYIGEAQGIRKHLNVQVTIEGGYITNVEVIEHYEKGAEYYTVSIMQVPEEIIKAQSPYVDAVSGSTLTSEGIMDAVADALNNAE